VLAANLRDEGDRRYLLVEMGDHFETLLKPRIQKVAYAADWRDGKPVAGSPGQSHMLQYIRLESYEDALNNIRFQDFGQKEPGLLDTLHAMPDYVLHYMLDYETAGSPSLLDLARFDHPFDYRLNITRGDVTAPHPVDLVTTFNFLLGLRVRTYRRLSRDGHPVVRVTGDDPRGRRVCVLWRDVPPIEDMDAERAWLEQHALEGVAADLLYVNGECALPNAVPIEPEFQRLMFEPVTGTGG
jgi:adenine-specific DNA-methyltransferase